MALPFWIAAGVTFWLGHLNAMCLCRLSRNERWVRWLAVGLTAFAVTWICLASLSSWDYSNQAAAARARVRQGWAASSTVMAALATLGVLVMSVRGVLQKPVRARTASYDAVSITCPNCQTRQTLPTPLARCAQCEMQFELRVIEPRCAGCDYLLLMYKGEQCPECGLPINRPPGPVEEASSEPQHAAGASTELSPDGSVVSLS